MQVSEALRTTRTVRKRLDLSRPVYGVTLTDDAARAILGTLTPQAHQRAFIKRCLTRLWLLDARRSLVRRVARRLISAHVASHRRGGTSRNVRNL